jgi:hypothetical protein
LKTSSLQTLKHHPLRTREPAEAQLFVIPVDGWLSQKAGTCNGHTHEARMHQLYGALTTQSWYIHAGEKEKKICDEN